MTLFSDLEKVKSPTDVFKNIYKSISGIDKFAYCAGFIVCFLVNAFTYTNTCFAHDSIQLYNDSTGIENGRVLVGPLLELINRMQIPWIIGLLACTLMGFVIVYISKIFLLKSRLAIVLCAGFVTTSEAMVSSHAYFNSVYIYILSLLFAVLAVYIIDRPKYGYFLSAAFLILSMMCYQAYIATAVGLFIVKMLLNIYESNSKIKEQILITVKYASVTVFSSILYYAIWQLILKLQNVKILKYDAYSNIGSVPSVDELFNRIKFAWSFAIQLLYRNDMISSHPVLMFTGCILCLIAVVSIAIKSIKKRRVFFTIVYTFTYILSINLMYIISGTVLYSLTVFSIIIPFLMILYLMDNSFEIKITAKLTTWVSLILCVTMIWGQAVCANSFYLKIKINYDNAWSYATRIIDRLEQTEGFNSDSQVVIINAKHSVLPYSDNRDITERAKYHTRVNITYNPYLYTTAITYHETLKWFILQEMSMNIDIKTNPPEFSELQEVKDMPIFPAEDSIKIIDGVFVVKI